MSGRKRTLFSWRRPPHFSFPRTGLMVQRRTASSFACRAKLGAPKAITATAHKLARIIYHMVTTRQAYDETICVQNEVRNRECLEARLRKQARQLGFQLVA